MKTTSTSLGGPLFRLNWKLLLPVLFCLVAPLHAGTPPGQLLAAQCFQCHGTNGQAVGGFESIAGKSSRELYSGLLEMSKRPPEGIMDLQARAFTPDQLLKIATYLSTLPATSDN